MGLFLVAWCVYVYMCMCARPRGHLLIHAVEASQAGPEGVGACARWALRALKGKQVRQDTQCVSHTRTHTHTRCPYVCGPRAAGRAMPAADALPSTAPRIGHLLHMPSHTYIRVRVCAWPGRRARAWVGVWALVRVC